MQVTILMIIFISLLLNTGCKDEPVLEFCRIIPVQFEPVEIYEGHCRSTDPEVPTRILSMFDMIGYNAVHPDDEAKAKLHHKKLHDKIEAQ